MKQTILILVISILTLGFTIPKPIEKKIDKEIGSVFEIDSFSKTLLTFEEDVESKMFVPFDDDNFFKILVEENLIGYFYYGKAPSKTEEFDFLVVFDKDLIIKRIKILAYREDYGGEISSKRWLKQFVGLTDEEIDYSKDIKAISGATISARSMTKSVNDLLKSVSILQNKNQL
ncbi:MAG: FMN-binding protein [Bacteroidota bacterium]